MTETIDGSLRRKAVFEFFLEENLTPNPDNIYKPRDGDIFVIGPPKSGTTWLQQILHQIRTKGDENFDDIYEVAWYIWSPTRKFQMNWNADQKHSPRVFKSHDSFGVINTTEKQKHIVIIRDPYDAVFSWKKFVNGYYGGDKDISEDELNDLMITLHEKNCLGSFSCISSWWIHRKDPNVLYLFYEDLKFDLKFMIRTISEFVEIPLTEEECHRITYLCSFEYMAQHKEKFQAKSVISARCEEMKIKKWKPKVGMVRTDGGQVGQGVKNIGPKLKSTIDTLWKNTIEKQIGFKSYQDMYKEHSLFAKNDITNNNDALHNCQQYNFA